MSGYHKEMKAKLDELLARGDHNAQIFCTIERAREFLARPHQHSNYCNEDFDIMQSLTSCLSTTRGSDGRENQN